LAGFKASAVTLSITTLDTGLAQTLEPRASAPLHRLDAIAKLHAAGVPVGVNIAPIIPGLNDHEIPKIAEAAAAAGAEFAGYTIVRLPLAVAPIFVAWLENYLPDRKDKILGQIRLIRNGKLNAAEFGARMRGDGPLAQQIAQIFHVSCRRSKLTRAYHGLSTTAFRRVLPNQLELEL
jgi:DNA repair photolyase